MHLLKKESKIEITLKNGKNLKLQGQLTTTKNWAIIESQQTTTIINREELTIIKENKQ
jgi:hypothetical protein